MISQFLIALHSFSEELTVSAKASPAPPLPCVTWRACLQVFELLDVTKVQREGGFLEYAYIYHLGAQVIQREQDIPFDSDTWHYSENWFLYGYAHKCKCKNLLSYMVRIRSSHCVS